MKKDWHIIDMVIYLSYICLEQILITIFLSLHALTHKVLIPTESCFTHLLSLPACCPFGYNWNVVHQETHQDIRKSIRIYFMSNA